MPLGFFVVGFAGSASAEPAWKQLHSAEATATSFLVGNWNRYTENYHPNYALDGNPATAWVEGADGDGLGEVLAWDVSPLPSARAVKLRIRNGYQKSADLLAANAAPKEVVVTVWRGREVVGTTTVGLTRATGWQDIVVDTGGRGLNHVELKVVSVTPGAKYRDTCLSDVQTWVDSDVPYNAAAELAKKAALERWITERVETARHFASLPPTWPFAAPAFRRGSVEAEEAAAFEAVAAPLRAAAERLARSPAWASAAVAASAPTRHPDGLEALAPVLRYLRAEDVAFFEASQADRKRVVEAAPEEGDWSSEEWTENFHLERVDGALRWAWTRSGTREEGRIVTTTEATVLLGYDDRGRLASALVRRAVDSEVERAATETVLLLTWSDEGKVARVEEHERTVAEVEGASSVTTSRVVHAP